MKLTKENIVKTVGEYQPKAIVVMVDEMTEVMTGSNYKVISKIQDNIGSIARLGRAAGCHLVLATQRPSSNVINADLKNNIQQSVLLGDFDSGISSLVFDEDISHMSKPEIKGRAFLKNGKEITEFQSYWTVPKEDFVYITACKENNLNNEKEENLENENIEDLLKDRFGVKFDNNYVDNVNSDNNINLQENKENNTKIDNGKIGEIRKELGNNLDDIPSLSLNKNLFKDDGSSDNNEEVNNKDSDINDFFEKPIIKDDEETINFFNSIKEKENKNSNKNNGDSNDNSDNDKNEENNNNKLKLKFNKIQNNNDNNENGVKLKLNINKSNNNNNNNNNLKIKVRKNNVENGDK